MQRTTGVFYFFLLGEDCIKMFPEYSIFNVTEGKKYSGIFDKYFIKKYMYNFISWNNPHTLHGKHLGIRVLISYINRLEAEIRIQTTKHHRLYDLEIFNISPFYTQMFRNTLISHIGNYMLKVFVLHRECVRHFIRVFHRNNAIPESAHQCLT